MITSNEPHFRQQARDDQGLSILCFIYFTLQDNISALGEFARKEFGLLLSPSYAHQDLENISAVENIALSFFSPYIYKRHQCILQNLCWKCRLFHRTLVNPTPPSIPELFHLCSHGGNSINFEVMTWQCSITDMDNGSYPNFFFPPLWKPWLHSAVVPTLSHLVELNLWLCCYPFIPIVTSNVNHSMFPCLNFFISKQIKIIN